MIFEHVKLTIKYKIIGFIYIKFKTTIKINEVSTLDLLSRLQAVGFVEPVIAISPPEGHFTYFLKGLEWSIQFSGTRKKMFSIELQFYISL